MINKVILETKFPKLRNTSYDVTSPRSEEYNCIAWAAGIDNQFWWPIKSTDAFWPIPLYEETIECFIKAFNQLGYIICDDPKHEPGCEKVAIYVKENKPKHMARQLTNGKWTSKCGKSVDIVHILDSLEGEIYGKVEMFMKRPFSKKQQ